MSYQDIATFSAFEQRFLRSLPQLDPVLTVFAEVIISLCDQYDTLVANAILTATFEFFNSNCMELTFESVPLIRDAGRYPWYLRDQSGVGKVYALMAFPKSMKIDITAYVQAVPDMNYWFSAVNDFLSSVPSYILAIDVADHCLFDLDSTRKSLQGKEAITSIIARM
jgi:Trichodiene synthase (TRI5)